MRRILSTVLILGLPATCWASWPVHTVTTLGGSSGGTAADVDGDGDLDLLLQFKYGVFDSYLGYWRYPHDVVVHRNLGGGTFGPSHLVTPAFLYGTYSGSWYSYDFGVGQFSGDGGQDVLTWDPVYGDADWYEMVPGGLASHALSPGWDHAFTVASGADLDGDGIDEIVAIRDSYFYAPFYPELQVLAGGGSDTFSVVWTHPDPFGDALGSDVDGDGAVDVVAVSTVDGLGWFQNLGGGAFGPFQVVPGVDPAIFDIEAHDADGDGLPELYGRRLGAVLVVPNLGGGAFGPQISLPVSGLVDFAVGDIDLDGLADVVTVTMGSTVHWHPSLGSAFGPAHEVLDATISAGWPGVDVADLNGDGSPDILPFGGVDSVVWLENPYLGIDADGDGVDAGLDCDDTDPLVHPGAVESCGNGVDDDCNTWVDELCVQLGMAVPGVAGVVNAWDVRDAAPSATVHLLYALAAGEAELPGCPGLSTGLDNPTLLASTVVDASGAGTITAPVPPEALGATVAVQAVDVGSCQRSHAVVESF